VTRFRQRKTPVGTWTFILANSVVFIFELMMPEPVLQAFFYYFGIVPARYTHPEWPLGSASHSTIICRS